MKQAEIQKLYKLMCGGVRIWTGTPLKIGETGFISRHAYLRIMNILERELGLKKRKRPVS